jgi:hypothetical protein
MVDGEKTPVLLGIAFLGLCGTKAHQATSKTWEPNSTLPALQIEPTAYDLV